MIDIKNSIKSIPSALISWKFWKELVIMTAGMMVAAAAVYYFLLPSKLVLGSISGLSIVIASVLQNAGLAIKVSTVIVIINAILLVLAFLLIGNEFGLKTVYTALILGPLMDLWEKIYPYTNLMTDGRTSVMGDLCFDLLAFVLILSASQAILFSINASTGGLDILAKIVNKYFHFDIGVSVSIAGICICLTALAINPVQMVLIGVMGTWVNGLIVDHFTAGLNKRKRVCIISEQHEVLREYIVKTINRGCSLYEVIGGYSGKKSMEIQSLLTQQEFADLMTYIKDNDIQAFITSGNVSEVYGLWNKHTRHK